MTGIWQLLANYGYLSGPTYRHVHGRSAVQGAIARFDTALSDADLGLGVMLLLGLTLWLPGWKPATP